MAHTGGISLASSDGGGCLAPENEYTMYILHHGGIFVKLLVDVQ